MGCSFESPVKAKNFSSECGKSKSQAKGSSYILKQSIVMLFILIKVIRSMADVN